jgi:hypothetical protein
MQTPPPVWGLAGLFASGWKLALLAFGAYALFGRRLGPFASRWLSPVSHARSRPEKPGRWTFGDKVYLLLLVMAATAVATWILARMTIAYHPRGPAGP